MDDINKTGIHFFPIHGTNNHKNDSMDFHKSLSFASIVPQTKPLPNFFSWKNFIQKARNQYQCGSCWAFSTCECIGSRLALHGKINRSQHLSVSDLMSCSDAQVGSKCNGGILSNAFRFVNTHGVKLVVPNCEDSTYNWCRNNNTCSGKYMARNKNGETNLNSLVKQCNIMDSCGSQIFNTYGTHTMGAKSNENEIYDMDNPVKIPDSELEDIINAIKYEIYHNGPVSTSYMVYNDFMFATSPYFLNKVKKSISKESYNYYNNWNGTGGIYINGAYDNVLKINDKYMVMNSSNQISLSTIPISEITDGGHSVLITGWGEKEILLGGKKILIPYWEIKNSWGTEWGDDGYFKTAISTNNILIKNLPLNFKVGFELPIKSSSKRFTLGGVCFSSVRDPNDNNMSLGEIYFEHSNPSLYNNKTNLKKINNVIEDSLFLMISICDNYLNKKLSSQLLSQTYNNSKLFNNDMRLLMNNDEIIQTIKNTDCEKKYIHVVELIRLLMDSVKLAKEGKNFSINIKNICTKIGNVSKCKKKNTKLLKLLIVFLFIFILIMIFSCRIKEISI